MSAALEDFERVLVKASRELHARAELAAAPRSGTGAPLSQTRRRLLRRARQLSVAMQLGLALSTLSALAAGGTVAYLALSGSVAERLGSIECNTGRNFSAIVNTITGNPIVDCAVTWPSATAGRSAAPPLAAWVLDSGRESAVVQPARWGRPAPIGGVGWQRLPAGWTVNLAVVELTDQLSDISTGLSGSPANAKGQPVCTYTRADERLVRGLLHADGLDSWRVLASAPGGRDAAVAAGCRSITPIVDGGAHAVRLIQGGPIGPAPPEPARDRSLLRTGALADHRLFELDTRVNRALRAHCQSVSAAAALWKRASSTQDFKPTTLAYWRSVNADPSPRTLRDSDYYYTLVRQPPSQHTGSCAHILVMVAGGGNVTVYAARLAP